MQLGDIKIWLERKGTYQEGASLYECLGQSQALKDLFRKGEFSFTRDRLRKAMEQLLQESLPAAKPASVSPSFPKNSPQTPEPAKRPAHPEVNGRLRPLLDERTMLHAQLERMGPLERTSSCLRIVELTKLITAIYFNLEKPEVDPLDFSHITDRADLRQQLSNARALRSKLKKNTKRQSELPDLETKIKHLEQLLN